MMSASALPRNGHTPVLVEDLPGEYWGVSKSPDIIARLRADEKWQDAEFPANDTSLFYNVLASPGLQGLQGCEWRSADTLSGGEPAALFRQHVFGSTALNGAADITQGSLGDCWFLSALSSVATKPELLKRLIVEQHPAQGIFEFRFFKRGKWVAVAVDPQIPVTNWGQIMLASSTVKGEFWVSLIEKAYAKLHGHYQCLHGGSIVYALEDLTGGAVDRVNFQHSSGKALLKKHLLLHKLLQAMSEGWLVTTTFLPSTARLEGRADTTKEMGLIASHGYTVLDLRQVPVGGHWLLRLRNPWGHAMWNREWSDRSREWTPEVLGLLCYEFQDDGTFWMSLEDYHRTVCELYITRLYNESLGSPFYVVRDTRGIWEGPSACGHSSMKNPQYIVSAESDSSVFVTVQQTDYVYEEKQGNASAFGEKCVGVWLLKCPDGVRIGSRAIYRSATAAPPSTFCRGRSVGKEFQLKAGVKYVVMPAQYHTGCEVKYSIHFYSPVPIWVLKTDVYGTENQWQVSSEISLAATNPFALAQEAANMWTPAMHLHTNHNMSTADVEDMAQRSVGYDVPFDPSYRGQVFEVQYDANSREEIIFAEEDTEVSNEPAALHELQLHMREGINSMMQRIAPAVAYLTEASCMNHLHESITTIHQWVVKQLGERSLLQISQASTARSTKAAPSGPRGAPSPTKARPHETPKVTLPVTDVSNSFIFDDELKALFDTYDKDGSGTISKADFKSLYKQMEPFGDAEPSLTVDRMLNNVSSSSSSVITYDEFAYLMLQLSKR